MKKKWKIHKKVAFKYTLPDTNEEDKFLFTQLTVEKGVKFSLFVTSGLLKLATTNKYRVLGIIGTGERTKRRRVKCPKCGHIQKLKREKQQCEKCKKFYYLHK